MDEERDRESDDDESGQARPGAHDIETDEDGDHHGDSSGVLMGKMTAPQAGIHRFAQFGRLVDRQRRLEHDAVIGERQHGQHGDAKHPSELALACGKQQIDRRVRRHEERDDDALYSQRRLRRDERYGEKPDEERSQKQPRPKDRPAHGMECAIEEEADGQREDDDLVQAIGVAG